MFYNKYYINIPRNRFGKHVSQLISDLKLGMVNEVILDLRNDFMTCELHYGLKETFLSIEDTVLVTKYQDRFILIDCSANILGYNIYNLLAGNVSKEDFIYQRRNDIYKCEVFEDDKHRLKLSVTL